MKATTASRMSPTSASLSASRTASGSAFLTASQRKTALMTNPTRASSTRLRVI